MPTLQLRPDIDDVMNRTHRFFSNGKAGDALVMINGNFSKNRHHVKGLDQWNFPAEMAEFLDACIKALEAEWQGRDRIADDRIPTIFPRYGIAEHSAFAAKDVQVDFSGSTSWPHPVIGDYSDMDKLELREDNPWLRLVIDGLAYLRERGEGKFAVKLRGVMAPMDLANALRGNDIFYDIYEQPEELHNLLSFCVKACEWFISRQKEVVGEFYGGTLIGAGLWTPGNSIGHLSEDASVLCSPESYLEFGKPYTEQLVTPYDQANMHLHTAGTHAFEHITAIDKLQSFELAPDPKQPSGMEVYKDNINLFGNRPMRIYTTLAEIKENVDFLKQAKAILHCWVGNVEKAEETIEFVRKELPIV